MANVTMSLQEYEDMRKTMEVNQSIVDAILSVCTEEWDVSYTKKHPDYSLPIKSNFLNHLSLPVKENILSILSHRVGEHLADNDIEGEFKFDFDMKIGYVRIPVEKKEGEE